MSRNTPMAAVSPRGIKLMIGSAIAAGALTAFPAQAASFFFSQATFLTGVPGATLIEDFESVTGAQLDTPLPVLNRPSGTYIGVAGSPFPNVFVTSPGYNNYGAGNNPTTSKILAANGDESFNVLLAAPASALGMNLYLNDFGDGVVTLYGPGDALLASGTFSPAAPNLQFFGFLTDPGDSIVRFTFSSVNGATLNTGIDDIYAQGAVPEPATWLTMIVGFGLAGAAMRRRRTTTTVRYA